MSILVIDPDLEDQLLIRDSFRRSEVPAALRFVTSTDAAFSEIESATFDLVLTDHALPDANAYRFLFEIRQKGLATPVMLLTRNGEARAAREAFHRGADDFLLKEDLESVPLLEVVGHLIEKRRQRDERSLEEKALRELADRDGLTGLYNRRYFGEALEREFERARRYRRSLSLVMVDLDGFKTVNDACGHPQGDQVLRQISRVLLQTVRFVDVVARYGGDEFAVILPETEARQAQRISQRVLKEIRKSPFLHEGKIYPLSASLGIACLRPAHDSSASLLHEADEALYEAKNKGRGRTAVALKPIIRGDEEPTEIPVRVVEVRDEVD
ncbi:MAG TPA: diguanylate cyclase [bacterium]|nr:diguanylate cyclase [bacterium]